MGTKPAEKAKKAEETKKSAEKAPKKEKVEAKTEAKAEASSTETHGHSERKEKKPVHHAHKAQVARKDRRCKIKACKRDYRAKGYCRMHYKKWRRGEYGMARYKTCKEMDCRKAMTINRHGYCEEHFQNYYVKGMHAPKAAAPAKPTAAPAEKAAAG